MRIGKPEHAVCNPFPELTSLAVDVTRVKLGKITGKPGEVDEIRLGDGPPRAAKAQPHEQIVIAIADVRRGCHVAPGNVCSDRRVWACTLFLAGSHLVCRR